MHILHKILDIIRDSIHLQIRVLGILLEHLKEIMVSHQQLQHIVIISNQVSTKSYYFIKCTKGICSKNVFNTKTI